MPITSPGTIEASRHPGRESCHLGRVSMAEVTTHLVFRISCSIDEFSKVMLPVDAGGEAQAVRNMWMEKCECYEGGWEEWGLNRQPYGTLSLLNACLSHTMTPTGMISNYHIRSLVEVFFLSTGFYSTVVHAGHTDKQACLMICKSNHVTKTGYGMLLTVFGVGGAPADLLHYKVSCEVQLSSDDTY